MRSYTVRNDGAGYRRIETECWGEAHSLRRLLIDLGAPPLIEPPQRLAGSWDSIVDRIRFETIRWTGWAKGFL